MSPDPLQDRVICPYNELLTEKVLLKLFHPVDECQKLLSRCEILETARLKALDDTLFPFSSSDKIAPGPMSDTSVTR